MNAEQKTQDEIDRRGANGYSMAWLGLQVEDKILRAAVAAWGEDAQLRMLQEEAAELSAEVSRFMRGRVDKSKLAEECADVLLMIAQVAPLVGTAEVARHMREKQARLVERLTAEGRQA